MSKFGQINRARNGKGRGEGEGNWGLDYVGSGQFNELGCILVGFR